MQALPPSHQGVLLDPTPSIELEKGKFIAPSDSKVVYMYFHDRDSIRHGFY